MRIDGTKLQEALTLIEAEHDKLKVISEMEDAGELHGDHGLYDDEAAAVQELEEITAKLKGLILST